MNLDKDVDTNKKWNIRKSITYLRKYDSYEWKLEFF